LSSEPSTRGCLALLFGWLLFLVTLVAFLAAFDVGAILFYGFMFGLPVPVVGLVVVSTTLSRRDRAAPESYARTLAATWPGAVLAVVLLHTRVLITIEPAKAGMLAGILAIATTGAVLVIHGYVEVLRDQIPPPGCRRTDAA